MCITIINTETRGMSVSSPYNALCHIIKAERVYSPLEVFPECGAASPWNHFTACISCMLPHSSQGRNKPHIRILHILSSFLLNATLNRYFYCISYWERERVTTSCYINLPLLVQTLKKSIWHDKIIHFIWHFSCELLGYFFKVYK